MQFRDRLEAGKQLGEKLSDYAGKDVVVYALPRGGVVLGAEVARKLNSELDLIIPRKIGHPTNPEYAVGAVTQGGQVILNESEVSRLGTDWLKNEVLAQVEEARRREIVYLGDRPKAVVKDRIAIIVDDGVATGLTVQAAIRDVRLKHPKKIILAVPVIPEDVAENLRSQIDELVALEIPEFYAGAVGAYFDEFEQVEDDEVKKILDKLKTPDG